MTYFLSKLFTQLSQLHLQFRLLLFQPCLCRHLGVHACFERSLRRTACVCAYTRRKSVSNSETCDAKDRKQIDTQTLTQHSHEETYPASHATLRLPRATGPLPP